MSFYKEVIVLSPLFNSTDRVDVLALLEPVTRQAVTNIITAAAELEVTLIAFETYRSQERQQMLFSQGATKLQHVGVHHYGLACDLVAVINGEPTWKVDYTFLGPLANQNGLVWGGDWGNPSVKHSFIDSDHVQRCSLAQQSLLLSGQWYPEDAYNPLAA